MVMSFTTLAAKDSHAFLRRVNLCDRKTVFAIRENFKKSYEVAHVTSIALSFIFLTKNEVGDGKITCVCLRLVYSSHYSWPSYADHQYL